MEGAAPDPTSVWLPEPLTQERAPDAPPLAESQLGDQTTWGQRAQDPRPCKKHKNTLEQSRVEHGVDTLRMAIGRLPDIVQTPWLVSAGLR